MSWPEIALGDIAELRNGLNYTKDNEGKGLRVINVKDFGDKSFPNYDELGELNPHGILRDKALLKHGDIVFVRSNGNKDLVGRSLFVNNPPQNVSFSAFCIRARLYDSANPRFYSYFFRTPNFRKRLALLGKGTNISDLNQQVLKMIRIPNPASAEKFRVVTLIRPYDDLIEDNRRRIQLLEQAAQLLYKEWFVHLRFPGHEHVKIVDGVPEGWEKKTIGKCFGTVLGGTPSRKNLAYWAGDVPWINSGEVNKTRIFAATEFIAEEGLSKSAAKLMPAGTTVLAVTGATLGQVSRLEIECSANQSVIGIYDKIDLQNEWLYLFFIHEIRKIINHATGGAQQHINKEIVNTTEFLQPKQQLLVAFREEVAPIFDQIRNVGLQNIALSKARDILLPRLMNGEVAV